jgi:hypothetical protein
VTYRDDRDALLHRVDALEDELERTRREAEKLRADNARLRRPPETEPAETVETEPVEPVKTESRALVKLPRPSPRSLRALGAGIASALPWLAAAVVAGPALWMLPAAVGTAVAAGAALLRFGPRPPRIRTLLPFDQASLHELVAQRRRAIVVKLDVRFTPLPSGSQRKAITAQLARAGLRPAWTDGVLTLSSRRLRAPNKADLVPPAAIDAFVQRAVGALGDLPGTVIASVGARAGS